MPSVSVLLPVLNCEQYIAAAINSILGQTLNDLELIVVDNGSTDATRQILEYAAGRDQRIRFIRQLPPGIVTALEAGRKCARAPYIARMDGDDVAYPGRLAAQVEYLEQHPGVVAVGGQIDIIDAQDELVKCSAYPLTPDDCSAYLQYGAPFCHPAVMMRREALARCGGYRHRFEPAEDFDLWLRLSAIGKLANLEATVLRYRVHGANVTITRAKANASAVALALVEATFDGTISCGDERPVQNEDWRHHEQQLPTELRMFARAAYLRALALNGGITDQHETSFLLASVSALIKDPQVRVRQDGVAFMLVRAAYQLARGGKATKAARLLVTATRHLPFSVACEAAKIVTRHLFDMPQIPRSSSARSLRQPNR